MIGVLGLPFHLLFAVTGTLLSAARFATAKNVQVDDVLRVTASLSIVSA